MSKEHKFSFNNKPQLLVCELNSQYVYIVINQDLMSDDDNLLKKIFSYCICISQGIMDSCFTQCKLCTHRDDWRILNGFTGTQSRCA